MVGGRALHYRIGAEDHMASRRYADEQRLPAALDYMPRSAPSGGFMEVPTLEFDTSLFSKEAHEAGRKAPWAAAVEDQGYYF